ncbi:hypothetical protein F4X88_09455 [Candidatus Poribacteria bacterium]|nr:hypothetical protein [Candidatus Poribacteria bacterium]MXV83751.1 hypothetical protein [Candidatus Poribacteria bacterium]MYA56508.1 hypothetical protein [Candidatus Poribacteria bacterium]
MTITIYTYPNNKGRLLEIPDDGTEPVMDSNQQLSPKEFAARLDAFTAKFTELVGPDVPPLSDYAVSREGIYEDHP